MPREGYVTIGVRGESNVIYNWMSFTRFRLAKFPNAADYNKLYIADDTKLTKGNATLPISLQNEDEIVGLQFDVVLPYVDEPWYKDSCLCVDGRVWLHAEECGDDHQVAADR